jgi:hypothetical protein
MWKHTLIEVRIIPNDDDNDDDDDEEEEDFLQIPLLTASSVCIATNGMTSRIENNEDQSATLGITRDFRLNAPQRVDGDNDDNVNHDGEDDRVIPGTTWRADSDDALIQTPRYEQEASNGTVAAVVQPAIMEDPPVDFVQREQDQRRGFHLNGIQLFLLAVLEILLFGIFMRIGMFIGRRQSLSSQNVIINAPTVPMLTAIKARGYLVCGTVVDDNTTTSKRGPLAIDLVRIFLPCVILIIVSIVMDLPTEACFYFLLAYVRLCNELSLHTSRDHTSVRIGRNGDFWRRGSRRLESARHTRVFQFTPIRTG